ncbi:MAG: phosphodiester glycosidase family protein [Acidobacteriota bacterium]|nr:phosphodiester glycosidase family protein [Acidobacteriota bacterium]
MKELSSRVAASLLVLSSLAAPFAAHTQTPRAAPPMGDVFNSNSCETPDRDSGCAPVRWGWGDCPGSKAPCDWCYGRHGVFAYVRRTNRIYRLSSGCTNLAQLDPADVFWLVADAGTEQRMGAAGARCQRIDRVGLVCQVPPSDFKQTREGGTPQTTEKKPKADDPAVAAARQIIAGWNQKQAVLRGGIRYTSTDFDGQKLHAVRLTAQDGFRVALAGPQGARLGEAVPTGEVGGVTGTFSNWPSRSVAPGGPVIHQGQVAAPNRSLKGSTPMPRSFLGWTGRAFFIDDLEAYGDAKTQGDFLQRSYIGGMGTKEGIGGLGHLLKDGSDIHRKEAMGAQGFDSAQAGDTPNARALAGVSADGGTLYLLVEEGDGTARPPRGAGTGEMIRILSGLGATNAVLLDGGGSAQIAVPSKHVDTRGGGGRKLPTWILF